MPTVAEFKRELKARKSLGKLFPKQENSATQREPSALLQEVLNQALPKAIEKMVVGIVNDERFLKLVTEGVLKKIKVPRDGKDADENKLVWSVMGKIRIPRDGKDANERKIVESVLKKLPTPADEESLFNRVKSFIPKQKEFVIPEIKGADIINAINRLPIENALMIDGRHVKNLVGEGTKLGAIHRGGSTGSWNNEAVLGTINGSNVTFTLSRTPKQANSLVLTLARQVQILDVDYTISGNTITYLSAPDSSLSGEPHRAVYS